MHHDEEADIAITPLDTTAVDIIGDLCDGFAEGGRPATVSTLCAALGVPPVDWSLFARWATDFVNPVSLDQLYQHLDVLIAQRCTSPGDDLLSELISLDFDGDGLTVEDLHAIVAVVLAGAEVG